MIKDVLKMRIGRSMPSYDFNNVLRPVTFTDSTQNIPSVSGLLYSTVFVNGSMLGALPGYYNSGNGVTVNFTPTKRSMSISGATTATSARGVQTGLTPPEFNGYYFNIGEIGINWTIGEGHHPGQFGIGLWRQTGVLTAPGVTRGRHRRRLPVRLATPRPRRQRPRAKLGDHRFLPIRRQQLADASDQSVLRRRHDGLRI